MGSGCFVGLINELGANQQVLGGWRLTFGFEVSWRHVLDWGFVILRFGGLGFRGWDAAVWQLEACAWKCTRLVLGLGCWKRAYIGKMMSKGVALAVAS